MQPCCCTLCLLPLWPCDHFRHKGQGSLALVHICRVHSSELVETENQQALTSMYLHHDQQDVYYKVSRTLCFTYMCVSSTRIVLVRSITGIVSISWKPLCTCGHVCTMYGFFCQKGPSTSQYSYAYVMFHHLWKGPRYYVACSYTFCFRDSSTIPYIG